MYFNIQLEEDVVKLSVMIRGIPRRKVYGHALLQLSQLLSPFTTDDVDRNHDLELIIYSSVSEKLVRPFNMCSFILRAAKKISSAFIKSSHERALLTEINYGQYC